jgi:hypothetical protein
MPHPTTRMARRRSGVAPSRFLPGGLAISFRERAGLGCATARPFGWRRGCPGCPAVLAPGGACDIRLRAEIRAGELLREMDKNKGARGQLQGRGSSGGRKKKPPEDKTPKLSDLGVSNTQSSR